ncbi:MAG: hypothetical protein HQL52_00845 [Magnetococcales bacterium]|nr:hypothetical protein [Magnetococcales bacterium]
MTPPQTEEASKAVSGMELTFLLLLLAGLYYPLTWSELAGFMGDDAVYLLVADSFSPWIGEPGEVARYISGVTLFPPMYSFVLGFFGGGSQNVPLSHAITTTFWLGALGVYGVWVGRVVGSWRWALGLLLLVGLAPGVLLHSLEIWSELPYLFFILSVYLLAESWPKPGREGDGVGDGVGGGAGGRVQLVGGRTILWAMALMMGLALLTRTAALSLVAAFGVWILLKKNGRAWPFVVIALLPWLVWEGVGRVSESGGYGGMLLGGMMADPGGWLLETVAQGEVMWEGWLKIFHFEPGVFTKWTAGVVLVLGLGGHWLRMGAGGIEAWQTPFYLGMILIWRFPDFMHRFLLVLFPVILLHAFLFAGWLEGRFLGAGKGRTGEGTGAEVFSSGRGGAVGGVAPIRGGLLAMVLVSFLAPWSMMVQRYMTPLPAHLEAFRKSRYWLNNEEPGEVIKEIESRYQLNEAVAGMFKAVPPGECVYALFTPHTMFYGDRVTIRPPPEEVDKRGFKAGTRACDFFFMTANPGPKGYSAPFYPLQRLPPPLTILATDNKHHLLVRWTGEGGKASNQVR